MDFQKSILLSLNTVFSYLTGEVESGNTAEPPHILDVNVETLSPSIRHVNLVFNRDVTVNFVMPVRKEDSSHMLSNKREVFTPLVLFASDPTCDLENALVVPGYYLSLGLAIWEFWLFKRDTNNCDFMLSSTLNALAYHMGVFRARLGKKENGKNWYFTTPVFFDLDTRNDINRIAQLRSLWLPWERVNDETRWPHPSHLGRVDLLETTETDKIGLRLFLVEGAEYDPQSLSIKPSKDPKPLSLSTSLVPFIHHSDSARVLMGAKNMKQAVKVVGAEPPLVSTNDMHTFEYGVNALVVYSLMKGLGFEDGIVVSESFAERMKTVEEKLYKKTVFLRKPEGKVQASFVSNSEVKFKKGDNVWSVRLTHSKKLLHGDPVLERREGKKVETVLRHSGYYPANVKSMKITAVVESPDKKGFLITVEYLTEEEKPLSVGDKLTGRHGNKGVVSKILPDADMPKVKVLKNEGEQWIPAEVVLSPMSVVSRMNLGQLLETHVGMAVKFGHFKGLWKPFERVDMEDLKEELSRIGADELGRFPVRFKGTTFQATAGYQYILRLDHSAGDKLHVVEHAKISPATAQPVKGRANFGGQRVGEMEFWTLFDHDAIGIARSFLKCNGGQDRSLLGFRIIMALLGWTVNGVTLKQTGLEKARDSILKDVKTDDLDSFFDMLSGLNLPVNNWKSEVEKWRKFFKGSGTLGKISKAQRKALIHLLKGKYGWIRDVILARRIHRSGRAVIVPVPELDVNTVLLPVEFAIEWLRKKLLVASSTVRKALEGDESARMEISEEANAYAENQNMIVLINRQPSLHKHSIQAFKARFWKEKAVGFPILACKGFNADFDGDTVAVYLPPDRFWDDLEHMLPSSNPYIHGSGKIAFSIDQDIVWGLYKSGWGDKGKILSRVKRELTRRNDVSDYLEHLKNDALEAVSDHPLSLSFFEAASNTGYMKEIRESKCRGGETQYRQLYEKVEGISDSNFGNGISFEDYFGKVKGSLAERGRKSLTDKKIHVGQAGYFTRRLVHFMQRYTAGGENCDRQCWLKVPKEWKDKLNGRLIKEEGDSILLFSPVQCTYTEICQKALGKSPSTGKSFKSGEYVGISSAHSIGERGTQLSMQTFHTGQAGFNMQKVAQHFFWPYVKKGDRIERLSEEQWADVLKRRDFVRYMELLDGIYIEELMGSEANEGANKVTDHIDVLLVHLELFFKALCDAYDSLKKPFNISSKEHIRKVRREIGRDLLDVLIFEWDKNVFSEEEEGTAIGPLARFYFGGDLNA